MGMRAKPWFGLSLLLFAGCCGDARLEQQGRELAVLNEKVVRLQSDLETLRRPPPPPPAAPVVVAPPPAAPPAPATPRPAKRTAPKGDSSDLFLPRF